MPQGPEPGRSRNAEFVRLSEEAREHLEATHLAREEALTRCRAAIRACGLAIRAVHRMQSDAAAERLEEAENCLRRAQEVLRPHPSLAGGGFVHDAEKEYAEARITKALVEDEAIPGYEELRVGLPAWLNGLAEGASELRRSLLDRLRAGENERAEELFAAMEDAYDLLVGIEYPDAITGGLRRATDSLRAVVERSRSDVTSTVVQSHLRQAIEQSLERS